MEGFDMCERMNDASRTDVAKLMYRVAVVTQEQQQVQNRLAGATASHGKPGENSDERPELASKEASAPKAPEPRTPVTNSGKIGRNEPCPCGSGKKYKNCCGKNN